MKILDEYVEELVTSINMRLTEINSQLDRRWDMLRRLEKSKISSQPTLNAMEELRQRRSMLLNLRDQIKEEGQQDMMRRIQNGRK